MRVWYADWDEQRGEVVLMVAEGARPARVAMRYGAEEEPWVTAARHAAALTPDSDMSARQP